MAKRVLFFPVVLPSLKFCTSIRTYLLLLLITCSQLAFGQTPTPTPTGFQSLLTAYYEEYLKLNPTRASIMGDYRYNDQLENALSQPYREQMQRLYTRYMDKLNAYKEQQLGERDKLNYQTLHYDLTTNLAAMEFPAYLTPMNQMFDFRFYFSLMGSGSSIHPFKSAKDYDDFLKRINGFVALTDTAIANMRTGMARNYVQPKVVIGKVLPQIKAMLVDDVTKSVFYRPVQSMPATFSAEDKQRLTTAYTTAITQQIIPAYNRLYTFLQNEYLPRCRETVGLKDVANGTAQYAYLVKFSTTTNMTPDEVHALGLSEVNRIRQAIEGISKQVGFSGDLKAFYAYVDTDPKFFPYKTEEAVLAGFQTIYQTMKPQLSGLFNVVPKTAFEIRPVEKYRANLESRSLYGWHPRRVASRRFLFPRARCGQIQLLGYGRPLSA